MSKRKNILLFTLVMLFLFIGVTYYFTSSNKENDAPPSREEIKPEKSVKIDSVAVAMVRDSIIVKQQPTKKQEPKPKIKSQTIKPDNITSDSITENIVKINLGSVGELTQTEQEVKTIEKQQLMFEPIDLPEIKNYVVFKYLRVEEPTLFVPKGQWLFGGTMQYSNHTNSNYKLLILEDWEGRGYTTSANAYLGYSIKDNLALGVKAGFGRTLLAIDNLNLSLGDDLNFNIDHAYYLNQQWSGTFFMRNFISLFKSRQFGLFNDTEITFSGGRGKMTNGSGEALKGTYESFFNASIGISPGIMVFMQNIAAIEVSVGILGFHTGKTIQETNQVYTGRRRTSGAKFGVDILSIKLGATFYLNNRNFKQR